MKQHDIKAGSFGLPETFSAGQISVEIWELSI